MCACACVSSLQVWAAANNDEEGIIKASVALEMITGHESDVMLKVSVRVVVGLCTKGALSRGSSAAQCGPHMCVCVCSGARCCWHGDGRAICVHVTLQV